MSSSSTHPLSQAVAQSLKAETVDCVVYEVPGKGLTTSIDSNEYKIGSANFCHAEDARVDASAVHVNIGGQYRGYFTIEKSLRLGIDSMLSTLKSMGALHLLSGDNTSDQKLMMDVFHQKENLHFNQSPEDKLRYLEALKLNGNQTLMFGDGLNDAGALKKAHVGVAVADDVYSFSPACDVILQSNRLKDFSQILKYIKSSISVVRWSIVISLIYNLIGLSFVVRGELTPIVAAILMPLSSITVVAFVSLLTTILAKRIK